MTAPAGSRGTARRRALAAAGCAALAFAAPLLAQPVPPPPGGAAGRTQAPGRFDFMGYTAPVPRTWEPLPTGSSFR
ncbi:MAG TPA: hypothetical protein VFZ93_09260, partial [Albitalea sp.]